jgi:hypothetical protein
VREQRDEPIVLLIEKNLDKIIAIVQLIVKKFIDYGVTPVFVFDNCAIGGGYGPRTRAGQRGVWRLLPLPLLFQIRVQTRT